MTTEYSVTNTDPAAETVPVSAKTTTLLDDLERRWAGLPEQQPTGPGVHDMTRPMTSLELSRWLVLRVANPDDLDGYLLQYAGKSRAEMDEMFDAQHGSVA